MTGGVRLKIRALEDQAGRQDRRGHGKPDDSAKSRHGGGGHKAAQAERKRLSFRGPGRCPGLGRGASFASGLICKRRIRSRHKAGRPVRHLGVEQVAAAGYDLDQLALVVAERGTNFADALEQAVLADMDIRPDRLHQLLLADDPPGIGGEQIQHGEGLRAQPDRLAIGTAQFGALLIELEAGEPEHLNPQNPRTVPGSGEYQKNFRKSPPPCQDASAISVA